jgi:hypothetical protein
MRESLTVMESLEPRRLMTAGVPRYDHVLIVVEENRDYADILGARAQPNVTWSIVPPTQLTQAPYLRHLADTGASLTNMSAEEHPSQPNYLALFSGSTQGVRGDSVPTAQFTAPSLGGQLLSAGLSFAGYSEDQPSAGFLGSKHKEYARKHNPWSDFTDVPASSNLSLTAMPSDFSKLPTVSFVVPNQKNDMHSGSIRAADNWLESRVDPYAQWARNHNSLLIVTWDEGRSTNHIPTIFYGANVRRGQCGLQSDHYRLLRTIQAMYNLPPLGQAGDRAPLRPLFHPTVNLPSAPRRISSQTPTSLSAWAKLDGPPIGPMPA